MARIARVLVPGPHGQDGVLIECCVPRIPNTLYETRWKHVAYAENWYPKPENPWTGEKFDSTRRECARHIIALRAAMAR